MTVIYPLKAADIEFLLRAKQEIDTGMEVGK